MPNLQEYQIRLKADPNMDNQNAAPPTVSQVAAIWIEDNNAEKLRERDIIVQQHDGHSQKVRYYYGCYDPLLFPLGEPGWHRGIKRRKGNHSNNYCLGQGKVIPAHATSAAQLLNTEETGTKPYNIVINYGIKLLCKKLKYIIIHLQCMKKIQRIQPLFQPENTTLTDCKFENL